MSSQPPPPSIAITGGGIASLTLTIALLTKCPHLRLTLYKSASAFGEIGAGVGFQPVMVRTMGMIDPRIVTAFEKCSRGNAKTDPPRWFTVRVGDAWKRDMGGKAVEEEVFVIPARKRNVY
jgi:salicylate hydroxylase